MDDYFRNFGKDLTPFRISDHENTCAPRLAIKLHIGMYTAAAASQRLVT